VSRSFGVVEPFTHYIRRSGASPSIGKNLSVTCGTGVSALPLMAKEAKQMSTYEIVRDAIQNKKVVVAWYDGHERIMCPHVLGTKKGRAQALFYQFAGTSKSGLLPDCSPSNWRCLFLDQLSNVASRDAGGEWHTAPNHLRPQTCVDQIEVEITI
jgi:hypothetical protein